jgi:zinc protease
VKKFGKDRNLSIDDTAAEMRLTDGVVRTVLDNGLTVLVKENHTSPVTALLVSVKAGYFNERDTVSGIAHVIEHMIFKGTPLRPEVEQFAREIRELGGTLNAATYYEETYYYVVVPSRNDAKAFEIQSDALQNALFDAAELAKEIEVIVQESLQKRDSPMAMLNEMLYDLAYDSHRIRRWRIGHPEPLRALTHDDLARFVHENYRPENIIVSIVGDVDSAETLALVDRVWGGVPRGNSARELSPLEPWRQGFRYRRLTGDQRQRLLLLHMPAPPITHPDAAPLLLLSAVMSDGRSARLYRRLKEELQVANSVWASYETFEQMGLFKIGAESIADDPLAVEQAIWAEVRRLQSEPILAAEIERVKTRIESSRLFGQEEVFGMARTLATYELLGDYRFADEFTRRLHAVTAEDLLRVARSYLTLEGASLLEYLPADTTAPIRSAEEARQSIEAQPARASNQTPTGVGTASGGIDGDAAAPMPFARGPEAAARTAGTPHHPSSHARAEEPPARLIHLPSGATLVFKARRDLPIVSVQALFHGGKALETPQTCGRTSLMLKASIKGTRHLTAEEIANRIEALGSGIGFSAGQDYFGYGFKVRRANLPDAFALFAEVLGYPAFPPAEVEREKQAIFGEIRRQQDSSMSLAYEQFAEAYYGSHPYGLPSIGIEEAVAAQTAGDVKHWHARLVTPANMVSSVVGDLDEEEAIALFSRLLPDHRGHETAAMPPPFGGPAAPGERSLTRRKKQTAAAMGFTGAKLSSDDRYALDVLDEITSSMGGRFFRAVRGENALAYSVSSVHRSRRDAGNFVTYTSTAPENEKRAREILLAECARLGREPATDQEIETAKATLYGEHVIGTQTFSAQASELAYFALNGLPLDEAQRYLARIQATTAEEVMEAAARHLTPDRYWLGVVRGTPDGE